MGPTKGSAEMTAVSNARRTPLPAWLPGRMAPARAFLRQRGGTPQRIHSPSVKGPHADYLLQTSPLRVACQDVRDPALQRQLSEGVQMDFNISLCQI